MKYVFMLFISVFSSVLLATDIRINAGGPEYIDSEGNVWIANDMSDWVGSARNATHVGEIANSEHDTLFHSSIWDGSKWVTDGTAANPILSIPIPNGDYVVDLFNMEHHAPNFVEGGRIFDVSLEGQVVVNNWDIWTEVGGEWIAQVKTVPVTVTDGVLDVMISDPAANAGTLNAIHIYDKPGWRVTASSTEMSTTPGKESGLPDLVIDGDDTTRWSSVYTDNEWLMIDFNEALTFDGITIKWQNAFGVAYTIEVSNDKQTWKTVFTETAGDGGIDEIVFPEEQARYLRLTGIERNTEWGYSIWELTPHELVLIDIGYPVFTNPDLVEEPVSDPIPPTTDTWIAAAQELLDQALVLREENAGKITLLQAQIEAIKTDDASGIQAEIAAIEAQIKELTEVRIPELQAALGSLNTVKIPALEAEIVELQNVDLKIEELNAIIHDLIN